MTCTPQKLAAGIIILIIIGLGYYTFTHPQSSGLKTYSDSTLSFNYPATLTVEKRGDEVSAQHSIAYIHGDPCDFRGDAPDLPRLRDFNVAFKVVNQSAQEYIESITWPRWEDVKKNPFTIGNLTGYRNMAGVEGCGQYNYFFVIAPQKTLAITRSFIAEFNPVNANYKTSLALPGIIPPAQEEEFFSKILESVRVR
jgi:hypothetical protein